MDRVQGSGGHVIATCTMCRRETRQHVVVSGRPRRFGHSPVYDLHRYRFCHDCGFRQTMLEEPTSTERWEVAAAVSASQ